MISPLAPRQPVSVLSALSACHGAHTVTLLWKNAPQQPRSAGSAD
jgi:hypothetical protein